jgi:hypothetical protein
VNWRLTALGILVMGFTVGTAASSQVTAQPQPSRRSSPRAQADAQTAHTPYQRNETWYEFMLKQFNPKDVDYGSWIERERRTFIKARIKNPYFLYSLSTSIGFLVVTALYTKLWIDHRRAMWITAEMMADVYNQDAYSRRVAQQAIEKYNTHIEHCNRVIEAAEHGEASSGLGPEVEKLRSELMRIAEERDTATRERDIAREDLRKKSEILAEMSVRLEALASKPGITSNAKQTPDVRGADPRLVTHINNLQEQLYAERNNNRRLRGG